MSRAAAAEPVARVAARVRELATEYEPPDFAHVPDPDAALFLCAVDHRTGYSDSHLVDGEGPLEGSALMWAVGLRAHRREGGVLRATRLAAAGEAEVAAWFRVDGETVADPGRRAALWRDLAAGLERSYEGSAEALLAASEGVLAGSDGLVSRLSGFEAYSDPLAKKTFLFAKICQRRGWLEVQDPGNWEVCADNVLMRLALRSGLVAEGTRDEVRAATRRALKSVASASQIPAPVLDDMLWELGRDDPDLLGRDAGDLWEPPRSPDSPWY